MEVIIRSIINILDKNVALTDDQKEVVEYALYNIIITIVTIAGVLALGAVFGIFPEAVAALITGAVFRWSMGGAHFSTPYRCMAVSIVLPLLAGAVAKGLCFWGFAGFDIFVVVFLLMLIATATVVNWRYAPAETENKPIPLERRGRLRLIAYITLLVWIVFSYIFLSYGRQSLVLASSFGLVWQVMSVTPFGFQVFYKAEHTFEAFGKLLREGERR